MRYILQKLSVLAPTLLGVSIISFALIRMVPGDPVLLLLGERGGSPEQIVEMKARLGLDLPIYEQYLRFIGNALRGDLGTSVVSQMPVWDEFVSRFPATLELGVTALFFATTLGIPLGVLAAVFRNSILDYLVMGISLIGFSMPIFWWGLILILFFSVTLGLTPVSGRIDISYEVPYVTGFYLYDVWKLEPASDRFLAFKSALSHLILPSLALGTIPLAVIARMTRSSMLEVIGEDYIRTARAKGLSPFRVIGIHALRNALIPVLTVIGLLFGALITGAILTETIFSWPGIGKWLLKSVTSRDYPVIQGGILLIATMVVGINLFVDFLYAIVNPKIRNSK